MPDLPKEFPPLKTHGIITPDEVINLDRRYRRIRYIGGGGFGSVYLVHHETLDRDMALKVLGRQYTEDEQFKERFKREAKNAAKLNHPNIVQVYDAGDGLFEGQKSSYITMEYVSGGTLEDLIAQQGGPLPPRTATKLTLEVARALEVAHLNNVIHRDIKPQNILLTESGEAKVADFGIARAAASSTRLTRTGLLMGTLHYMSPEQANGKPASPRSDLYSLGVVLYQTLTGQLPFDAETPAAVMVKHISEPVCQPKDENPEVPEGLNEVCVRLLAKDPEDRYPSASALIEALEELLRSPVEEEERPPPERPTFTEEERPTVIDRELEKKEEAYFAETIADKPEAPSTVEVPNLKGQDVSQANEALANRGLDLGAQEEVFSDTIPEGKVVRQSPEAETEVEVGRLVSVAVSSGPQEKATPVSDMSQLSVKSVPDSRLKPEHKQLSRPRPISRESGILPLEVRQDGERRRRRRWPVILILLLLPLLLAVLGGFVYALVSITAPQEVSNPPPVVQEAETPTQQGDIKLITIRVTGTPGVSFSAGAYCANSCGSLEGVTPQDFEVEARTGELVTANVQNQSDGNQELKLQIIVDGKVVKEQSTTEQGGVVMVTVDKI